MLSPSIITQRRTIPKDTSLDAGFLPGQYDVICSRGKESYNHSGNIHFRRLIEDRLQSYKQNSTKMEKSLTVISIVHEIRELSPDGGFVKFCKQKNCYVEVGDQAAREKTGHALRERMSRTSVGVSTWKIAPKPEIIKRECSLPLHWKKAPKRTSLLELFAAGFPDILQSSSETTEPEEECIADFFTSCDDMIVNIDEDLHFHVPSIPVLQFVL